MINEIADVIKNLRLHIGKESFLKFFFFQIYIKFLNQMNFIFCIIEFKIGGVKFSDYKIEK